MSINEAGTWLSIVDYSHFKNVSISTLRRHIQADLVKWKKIDGKYFIFTKNIPDKQAQDKMINNNKDQFEYESLKNENLRLKEEIAELKMLVQLYEGQQNELPPSMELFQ
jgi:hypothetical protein